jgi:hypothetical protein
MLDEHYSTQRMLVLRRLTRAISELLHGQLRECLSALAPLLRPRSVLGEYVQGGTREGLKGSEKALQELQSTYRTVASSKPFNLSNELRLPLHIASSSLEITPAEYTYTAKTDQQSKSIVVTSPLRWLLTYVGFSVGQLKTLLADRNRTDEDAARFILHYTALSVALSQQPAVRQVFEALRFPISASRSPELGELPLTYVSSSVPTVRPPDKVIIESTELSGRDVFEEVVDVDAILAMRDPLKDRLLDLIKSQGVEV